MHLLLPETELLPDFSEFRSRLLAPQLQAVGQEAASFLHLLILGPCPQASLCQAAVCPQVRPHHLPALEEVSMGPRRKYGPAPPSLCPGASPRAGWGCVEWAQAGRMSSHQGPEGSRAAWPHPQCPLKRPQPFPCRGGRSRKKSPITSKAVGTSWGGGRGPEGVGSLLWEPGPGGLTVRGVFQGAGVWGRMLWSPPAGADGRLRWSLLIRREPGMW